MSKNVNNDSNYVYINSIRVSHGVPALLLNSDNNIEHELHDDMINALMKGRCTAYNGGHWDSVVYQYTNMADMQKHCNQDLIRTKKIVDKYFKSALYL